MTAMFLKIFLLCSSLIPMEMYYMPWLSPVTYCPEENKTQKCKSGINLFVNQLDSTETLITYDYGRFDFCQPDEKASSSPRKLAEIFSGDRIRPSPYTFKFGQNRKCQEVCTKTYAKNNTNDQKKLDFLKKRIKENFNHHWIIDNMPVTWCYEVADYNLDYCDTRFPIGCLVTAQGQPKDACVISNKYAEPDTYYLFNHVSITIEYHDGKGEQWEGVRLLSARIVPLSIQHDLTVDEAGVSTITGCNPVTEKAMGIKGKKHTEDLSMSYTYDIEFKVNNNKRWHSRWDYILEPMPQSKIYWFSIMNSAILALFLIGVISIKVTLKCRRQNPKPSRFDEQEASKEIGSVLLPGLNFDPPAIKMVLCMFIGQGIQLCIATLLTIVTACFGFLSPANRGALVMFSWIYYMVCGLVGGYVSGRVYKTIGGQSWIKVAFHTSFWFPCNIFFINGILNCVLLYHGSASTVPLTTQAILVTLWVCISKPLTYLGAYLAFKQTAIKLVLVTNKVLVKNSHDKLCCRLVPSMCLGGIIPFGAIFIQTFFIFNSLWSHSIYYKFGFLLMSYVLMILSCAGSSILFCYRFLHVEDNRWWWRSFLTSGFTGVYVFIYSIHYYSTKLTIAGSTNAFLFFGYNYVLTMGIILLTGSIGFLACFFLMYQFNKKDLRSGKIVLQSAYVEVNDTDV